MRSFRVLLLSLLLLPFSAFSAQDWYWQGGYNYPFSSPVRKSKDPAVICAYSSPSYPTFEVEINPDGNSGFCHLKQADGYLWKHAGSFTKVFKDCPGNEVLDPETLQCKPEEPKQCDAGKETFVNKFIPKNTVPLYPPRACLNGCEYEHSAIRNCSYPWVSGDQVGSRCEVVYVSRGLECEAGPDPDEGSGDGNDPSTQDPADPYTPDPDDPNDPANPDPDEPDPYDPGWCPPGYVKGPNTNACIKDPNGDNGDDPGNGDGDGDGGGDGTGPSAETGLAKDSSLKDINKTLKDIDKTIKAGDSKTHTLLQGIKDAIGKIPGGGGSGPGNGSGTGDGEGGDGEGCSGEDCGFVERDYFGDDVPTFDESFDKIYKGMAESPIAQSLANIQFPSGGSCPTGSISINVMGKSMPLRFESHCTLWEKIAPVISAAFLALWALISVRVFLSA